MEIFRARYPSFLKWLYPDRVSRIKDDHSIYLTFDDGPIPVVTPWVLDQLKKFHAKATFFCIGENIQKHPEIFQRIISEGHAIGNHTYNHLNGWNTSNQDYLNNILEAEEVMCEGRGTKDEVRSTKGEGRIGKYEVRGKKYEVRTKKYELWTKNSELKTPNFQLFRPPFGKIKNSQAKLLKKAGYQIVMWDVISGDYNENFTAEECKNNVLENTKPGSTIVFHDSRKAFKNLKEILPEILQFYAEKGLRFKSLDVLAKKAN
ncbi:polysaccharide deacetylase family protein [Gramella sp. AN32]|uniref:Polysaccharide deacetylase family protein n=1 Tax=Christiangramia antarctica TaxID=2058158 RepID=A0ABW5X7J4_9FLAO|nr:polysaccharide deacetylase family protein [Gramella sp. AN32]MCM4155376.1 polysaccharide deacetylase family protein [Gramella sp. AN32]